MATNLRDRGYGSSMDNYNAHKRKVEERKEQEKTTGPVSTLRLPKVNSTASSRAASTSAPIQTQRFYDPNVTRATPGTGGGRGTPHITEQEFNRSTAMTRSYGNYNNYLNGIHVTGSGFADPDILFKNEPNLKNLETVQNQFDQALNVVSGDFEKRASDYERWYRTITNQYQPMSDAQKAQGDQLYADYMKSLDAYQKMSEAHMKASASNAGVYANVSSQRRKWYDSIRDEKDIDIEEKDLLSQLDLLEDQKYKVQSESSYAKTQTLHGITTAQGLETVMNSTDELDRLDRQIDEVKAQLELLDKERAYSRYFKWQELANNNMPVSARRMQGGAPSWLDKIISGTATEEEIMQAINEGNVNPSNIAEMLDDEKQTYRAIYQQYGPAKAKEYVDELERYGNIRDSLNTRRRMTDETKLRNWVKKGSPFGRQFAASVLTVLASPTKVLSYVGQGADYLFSGEMTKDADYNVFSYAPNAVTAQIGENITKWGEEHGSKWIQKWGDFGYQTALSILTFLYTTALTGGFGLSQETMFGVELYNQGYRTAEAVSAYKAFKTAEALSLGLMGTEAAADAVMQAKDRGLDDGQAFMLGTAAGAIEILTEKFSVENLLEGVGDRNRLLYFLKSMFTEGSEEVASDFSNMLVDSLVAKDKSEFNQSVKNYMKEYGVSKQEALKAVWTEQLKSVGLSGLGGAISGGFMGGGNIVRSNVSNLFNRSAITSPENVANIINRAQGLNEWSAGARSASALQGKLDAGEKFTIREVLKARNAIETDRKTDPKYVKALIEAAEQFPDAKKQADKLQANLDNGKVKVEDVEKLEEAIDLERLVDPNREDLQTALKYGETADQKSEAYKLTKGIRDKIAAGEKLSLEEVSAAESAVNTAKATSAEGLKSTIESGLASDQNSPAYRAAQQLQSKLDSGAEITLAEVSEARRAVRQAEEADFSNTNPEVIGRRLITESGRQALTDAATILKNSTSQSDVQRGNQMLQAIKDGNLDAKTAGEVFLRSQQLLENTRKQRQNIRVLQPREVTADMDAYDRSAAKLGVSVEEAAHNKAILQAFGVDGEYKSFENNNLSAYYDRSTGKVYINANADNPGLALIAHEVTHSFENTAGYKRLADLVFSQSKDLNADLQRITQEYADAGINLDDEGARSELVSEFVEQHMFNDEKFINDVVSTDRSLGQKILRTLDNLLAKLGNKNAQQRQLLRHARDLWAEALQQRMTSDKAKAKIAEKRSEAKKLSLPAVEAKAAAVRKTEGLNLPKAENRKIQAVNAELNQYGINIDADSGAAVSYSIRTAPTTVDEIKLATDRLVNAGFDRADAEKWLKSLTSVSSVIMQNMQELDYEADERYTWLKTNSDYTQGSVDFNNNCPKRVVFTSVFDQLQKSMPDRVFTAEDYETIRQILIKHKIPVTCGPCFVEDRRQHTGEIAQNFIDQLKDGALANKFRQKVGKDTYVPTQYDLTTYEGLRELYDSHRGIHDAFVAFNNARGMAAARLLEGMAEYNNQIKKWDKRTINSKNSKGGLRIFSLSDADPRIMLDIIQIVTDSAENGLMIQGYTKKPWFAKMVKDTGMRILRSHIPAGSGVRDGKLVFDNTEGINTNDRDYFDATNEKNIGDNIIGINDEMIRIAMLDPNIDQIIPFHSSLKKSIRDQKKIGHWQNYKDSQTDKFKSSGKVAKGKQINIYKDVIDAWAKKGSPVTNKVEFVNAFLQVCDERGLTPRFAQFLNTDENGNYVYTDGYEKFLVDYKLFDRTTGEIIPQEAVRPEFDDAFNKRILTDYVKSASNLPKVDQAVLNEIKRQFTDGKLSLPKAESKQYAISKSDTAYLKAVESGDMETAQRMVDEAARRAGYTIRAFHGTTADFNVFDGGAFFTDDYWNADGYANGERVIDTYLKLDHPLIVDASGAMWDELESEYGSTTRDITANLGKKYDGVIFENINDNWTDDPEAGIGTIYWVRESAQAKSADPVTYDDSGKPIPLSERFNPENKDIRYAVNKDATIRDDQELRDRVREIQDQLDMAEMNGLSDAEIRRLNGQLYKAQAQLDQFTARQRGLAKKTSINDIIANIDRYDRMDLESLAEQISDNAWDDYEELGDEELREAIVDALNGRMDEMDPGDADKAKYGFYVKPARSKVLSLPVADRRYAINKDATIRTEGELIDSIIDPKETAKAGVENALDSYLDSIGAGSDIPGMDKISTGTKKQAKLPASYKAQDAARFFYRKMVDSGEAVTRLGRYSNDPHLYHYYNMARASSNAAVSMIQDAQTDTMGRRVGDSLNDIFSSIRKKGEQYYADLQAYLYHTHNIDRMSRANPGAIASAQAELEQFRHDNPELANMADFQIERLANDPISFYHDQAKAYMQILRRLRQAAAQHNKPVFGQEVSAEQSRRAAEDLREKLSETEGFEEDVEKIYQYIDNLMQYRIDSGLITEEEYQRLKEIYPHYVPTFREQEPAARNKRGNTTEIGKTVGRAQGGDTRLIPLHRALAQQTFSVVREGSKNRFGQMLLEGKQNNSRGMIKNVEEAEGGFHEDTFDEEDVTPKKENTFIVRQGGKRYEIGMDNALYEAVTALSPEPAESNFLINFVHKSNDLFKALCTGYNPTFLVRNFMRDLQDAGLYSKDLSEFSKNYPLAYKEITTNGKYWQMYKALGGLYSSFFDYQTGELKQSGKVKKYTVDAIESVNMAVEQAPRLAEFMATVKKAEKAGNLSMDTLMEAIYNAADVTVNFGRSGKWGKMFNRSVVPFFNPGVQGFDKMVRNVTETKGFKDWARLAAKATILGIAPAVISRLLFGKRKDWDEIKQRDKDIYYLFPLQDGVWLKLPKGRVLSVFGMAADRAMQGKDADWASFIETSLTQTAPENPLTASYWRPWLDAKLFDKDDPGKTWYGSDIENQRLRNLAPGQRYDTTTDALSKWLGKTFNLSPKKINYLLDQYSGVIGDVLLPLTSDRAEKGLFTNAFTIDSVVSNQLSEDFYDMKDRLTWAKNDPNATGEDEALYKYWNEQTSAISDINKAIRAIEQDKSLTDKEKRDLTRVQYSLRNGIMRNALDSMSDYRAGGTDNDIYSKVSDAQAQEERESKTYNFKGQDVAWDDLSGTQKKIVQAQDAIDSDPNADLSEIIGKGNATKKLAQYQAARDQGISNQTYIDALQAIDDADDGNGNYNQAEAKAGLDKLISDGTISEKEAGTLWKIITGGADKNNPFPVGAIGPIGLRLPKIG